MNKLRKPILRITAFCLGALFAVSVLVVGISAHMYQPQSDIEQYKVQPLSTVVPVSQAVVPPPIETVNTSVSEPVEEELTYTEEDLDLLSRLIFAEVGCEWIPDDVQLYVGSVVLNRVDSDLFPDNIYDVIYAKGQYSPTQSGSINNTPDERTIENARKLLEDGSILPANVVFQANFKQGSGVYYEYYDEPLGTTTYFCYI